VKMLWWAGLVFVAVSWTGVAWVTASLAQWGAQTLASGAAVEAGRAAAQWPVPPWVSLWADPAWVAAAQDAVRWGLDALAHLLPAVAAAGPWLVAAVWGLWGAGMIGWLLIGVLGHLALRRWAARTAPTAGLASGVSVPR